MIVNSNAKINIGLKILDKREDGYHTLDTIFAELDWGDSLEFVETITSYELVITNETSNIHLPTDDTNLITRAYRLLQKEVDFPVQEYKIHLTKRIPMGGGLGGGSSNAAVVLTTLNRLWKLNYSNERLQALGVQLGADIPFFIKGGIQRGRGIGEKLSPIMYNQNWYLAIIVPPVHTETKKAYNDYKNYLNDNWNNRNITGSELTEINLLDLKNDFEPMFFNNFPEIEKTKSQMIKHGAFYTSLSGSGSAYFGVFHDQEKAKQLISTVDSSYFSILTKIKFN